MSDAERINLRIGDGIVCDDGTRGIITSIFGENRYAYVQWETGPRMRSAAVMGYGINPLSLSESRSLALELAVAEALA